MLTSYQHELLEHLVEKLGLSETSDLADYKYFDKQIFLGQGGSNLQDDFTGMAIAVLLLKLNAALSIISGMQQGGNTNSVFDREQSQRLKDILDQIDIALKGTITVAKCPRCEEAMRSAKQHLEAFQARAAERETAMESFP